MFDAPFAQPECLRVPMTIVATSGLAGGMGRQGCESAQKKRCFPGGVFDGQDHSRNEGPDASVCEPSKRRRAISDTPTGLVPGAGSVAFEQMVPLKTLRIVSNVAAVALGRPGRMAGVAGQGVVFCCERKMVPPRLGNGQWFPAGFPVEKGRPLTT